LFPIRDKFLILGFGWLRKKQGKPEFLWFLKQINVICVIH